MEASPAATPGAPRPEPLATSATSGRPVAIDLADGHGEELRRWVEGVLGWQVVDHPTSRLVPPTVHLLGPQAQPPDDGVPRILVVTATSDPSAVIEACRRLHPQAGLTWPAQQDALPTIVEQVAGTSGDPRNDRLLLRVGGVAGGVGTTTVVLALAGLSAWQGRRSLATVRGDAPVADLPVVPAAATAALDLWSRLPGVPGVPACRAVRLGDPQPAAEPADPSIDLAVFDEGVATDVDVAVCRPDAAALERLPTTTAAAIVVIGGGPLRPPQLREATGGRPTILLPWSTRVARAALHRRVPGSLPGTWLRRLRPLLPEVASATT